MSLENKIQLRTEEQIELVVRRAAVVYAWRYFLGFAALLATSFYLIWLLGQGWWGVALTVLGYFLGVLIIFHAWFFWKMNVLVVTNERVIDINRLGWFEELISSITYNDVKDIYLHRKGMWASIFNYASIVIESKSQRAIVELPAIAKPEQVLAIILDKNDQFEDVRALSNRKNIYQKFLQIIPDLSEEELCETLDLVNERLEDFENSTEVPIEVEDEE